MKTAEQSTAQAEPLPAALPGLSEYQSGAPMPPIAEPGEDSPGRVVQSFADRLKIVDGLRQLRGPIIAKSKAEAAAKLGALISLDITWHQIKYCIEQLPEEDLASRFVIGDEASASLAYRVGELEADLESQDEEFDELRLRMDSLTAENLEMLADIAALKQVDSIQKDHIAKLFSEVASLRTGLDSLQLDAD